ncbi:MAG TPA: hypothetical protein DCZ92_06120 [Elusimicrobia bacterium]|nr:MAG: hypothetical protein A2016_08145 [Elusimicrobia bacterium GWF2_62_30]HBA60381.1 hypothetical protein [Elusimicrobiota bacterium]
MQGNKKFILSWTAGAVLLLLFFYAAMAGLWEAARASAAAALEKQVSSVLAGDLSEGNLFKLGASLSRLMQAGSLDYAEIRSFSRAGGWEKIFRTHSRYGDTDKTFSGFQCGSRRDIILNRSKGLSLVTTLPSNIAGSECVALLVSSDLPSDLKKFRNRLAAAFGILLVLILVFFLRLTIAWHKKTLGLEVAARTAEAEKEAAIGRMAAQVAHDIRSPLVALDTALKNAAALPEEQRVMARHAVNRIRDIANHLLEKHKTQPDGAFAGAGTTSGVRPQETHLLSSLIEPVVAEKRLQFEPRAGIAIEFDLSAESYGLFAAVQPVELRRLVSNLLNNAVEAIAETGTVRLSLASSGGSVLISVEDTGKGIPAELLGKLGQKGETYGKPGGSGLGLYHARTMAESWGGKLELSSGPGGTKVTVSLPAAAAPAWFVSRLELPAGMAAVVLDDDDTIHQVWKGRFESSRVGEKGVELYRFSSPDKFRGWIKDNPAKAGGAVYLLDYELLGFAETGLSLAQELGLADRAILVTSRYEEKRILEECLRLKIRMIPKGLAGLVPVSVRTAGPRAVLLDDDMLVHMNWKLAAKAAGVEFLAYKEPEEFLSGLGALNKDTPIYIDSSLGDGVKGEDIAVELHEKGFTDLTMATGHGAEKFAHLAWLKAAGKEPPWK